MNVSFILIYKKKMMAFKRDWQQYESSASWVVGWELVLSAPAAVTVGGVGGRWGREIYEPLTHQLPRSFFVRAVLCCWVAIMGHGRPIHHPPHSPLL